MYIIDETADVIIIENILLTTFHLGPKNVSLYKRISKKKIALALSIFKELLKNKRVINILANLWAYFNNRRYFPILMLKFVHSIIILVPSKSLAPSSIFLPLLGMFENLIWAYPHINMKYFGHFRYLLASWMIPMSCSGLNQSTSSTYHLIFNFIKKWQRFTSLYINGCLFLTQCFQKLSSNPSNVVLFYSSSKQ